MNHDRESYLQFIEKMGSRTQTCDLSLLIEDTCDITSMLNLLF